MERQRVNPGNTGKNQNTRKHTRQGKARQGKARLRQLTGLRRVAIARRVIYAIQYSAITERKSNAYKACVIV